MVHAFAYPILIPFFLIPLAVIALFGIAGGLLINKFKSHTKAKAVGIVFLLVPFLFIANFVFLGNPIGSLIARGRIETYVSMHFPEFDFVVGFPRFHLSTSGYHYSAIVHARNNRNKYFEVIYFGGSRGVNFAYHAPPGRFSNGYNNVIRYLVSPLMEDEFADNINRLSISRSSSSSRPEYSFSIELQVESLEPHLLLEKIIRVRDVIERNGIEIRFYDFHFISDNENKEISISRLTTGRINDGLIVIIEEIQKNVESSGFKSIDRYFPDIFYRFRYIP